MVTKRILLVAFALSAIVSFAFAFPERRQGDKDASGSISSVTYNSPSLRVKGSTKGGPLWLAWSTRSGKGDWVDYKPVKVNGSFDYKANTKLVTGGSTVRVALWRYKVTDRSYAMGFRMEDRVDMEERSSSY